LTNVRKCDTIAPNLPYDIKAFLQSPTSAAAMLNAKRTSERKHLIELIVYYQLLQWIIKLYQADPGLAFHYKDGDVSSESHQLMTGMVSLVQHHAPPHLPLNASQVLLKLHEPQNIELWDPTSVMGTFWDISGQVTYYITQKLFSRKATEPLQLLKWLKMILNYRTMFLRRHSQEASQGVNYKVSQQLYTMLETVLLLFLRNTDIDAVQVAMTCFKFLVSEAELVSSPTEPVYIPYAANLRPYKQLEELSKTMQIGRVAQQKRIRSILKDLVHTPGSALAWENTYSSWKISRSLLVSYNNPHYDSTPPDILKGAESFPRTLMRRVNNSFIAHQSTRLQEQLTEETLQATLLNWTNMTGFLCSLAGVSTKSSQTYMVGIIPGSSPAPPQPSDVPQGVDMVDYPSSHNGGGTTSSSTGLQPVSQPSKVKRSASLHGNRPKSIVAPPPQARLANQESVRFSSSGESLASADDPLSMRNLPQTSQTESFIFEVIALLSCDNESVGVNIRETVKEYVSGELSPIIYPYLFQGLQEELDRITTDEQLDITEGNTLFVNQVTSIVQRIVDSKSDGPGLDNLGHVKVDQVLFTLVRYADYLGSNDEKSLTLKIKICGLLQTVVQQSQELSFHNEIQFRNNLVEYLTSWVSGDLCIGDTGTHEDNLKSELDLSAMKAVSLVLSGLPLQPKDIGNDIYEEKGKLFLKYFDTFLNLIHSMNSIETSKLGHLKKAAVTRHVSSLREATILAMSNMLTANIDSGLTHAISLGYHNDLRTRTSFIEVMTSILKQGAEFHSLADSALADRYNELLDLVTMETEEGEHPIMIALINSVPFDSLDDLAELLVLLFDYKNRLTSFLTQILMTEVDALESGKLDTLFRGNTIACKVLSIAFKTFGLYYLQSVLRPLILNLMKTQENDYEVDPARLQNPAKLRANQTCLLELVNSFYDTILKSQPSLPLQLRTVCHILYQVVVEKLPDCGLDTVNSAIFLRFINPAIVSPQSYNLVQGEIPTGVRRALTLISKVLQNLANHVLFKKEAHMKVFNEFLENNFEKSRNLACSMASMGPFLEGEAVEHIPFLKEAYKHRLHSLLWNNQDRIASFAASTRAGITTVRPIFHKLNTLLAQLGAPNTPKRRPTTITARNALVSSQLEEFLDNMNNECDEKTLKQIKAKEFFYEAGYSKAGNPLFYLIVRKFRGDQLRMSYQLLYHMMIVLKSRTDRSFELIIDLTQASQLNEPDLELLIKFAAYIPELLMNQIDAVYFYNPNMSFKDYATNLSSSFGIFSHIKGSKKLVMIDKFAKFQEHIELREIRLPQSTMEFESDCGKDYIGHYLVLKQQTINRYAVIISVLPCGFVLTTAEKYIILDRSTPLKEMYHISNVREVGY
jgi:neurofibromin 1